MTEVTYAILYTISSLVFSLIIAALGHLYCKITGKKYNWANYVAAMIIMAIILIAYELMIEPFSEWLSEWMVLWVL